MTDPHMTGDSPEVVALKLLQLVAIADARPIGVAHADAKADRKYILNAYAECLEAVRGRRGIPI